MDRWSRKQESRLSWTDDLSPSPATGLGVSANQRYHRDGNRSEVREMEDTSFHHQVGSDCLYGVFDGHEGRKVAEYARQRFPAELLLGQLEGVDDDERVVQALQNSFLQVERAYFSSIDGLVAEKAQLQLSLPQGMTMFHLYQHHSATMERISEILSDISGGCTAVVALVHAGKLSVANVGDSRALLCTTDDAGNLYVEQLTVDHNTRNSNELERLARLGLDVERLGRKLGNLEHTRTIGDFALKGDYKDFDILSSATSEPVIASPHVSSPRPVTHHLSFLVLMSDGLYQSLEEATNTPDVNYEIAKMVNEKLHGNTTVAGAAQAVVDKIGRLHQETNEFTYHGDMTLLLRNFNHPLKARRTPHADNRRLLKSYEEETSALHITLPKRSWSDVGPKPSLVAGVDSPPAPGRTPSTASTINRNDPFSPLISPALDRSLMESTANTPPPILPTSVYRRPSSTSPTCDGGHPSPIPRQHFVYRHRRIPSDPTVIFSSSPPARPFEQHMAKTEKVTSRASMSLHPHQWMNFDDRPIGQPLTQNTSRHRRVPSDPAFPQWDRQELQQPSPFAGKNRTSLTSPRRRRSDFTPVATKMPRQTSEPVLPESWAQRSQATLYPSLPRQRKPLPVSSPTLPAVIVGPSSSGASPKRTSPLPSPREVKDVGKVESKDSGIDGSDPETKPLGDKGDDERTLRSQENTVKAEEVSREILPTESAPAKEQSPDNGNRIPSYIDFSIMHLPNELLHYFEQPMV
eukprot:m.137554 g.137554  ORF g.137554 m.137554 type:complete len:748 (+) comp38219_c0_seq52:33-2276(+)